MFRFKQFTISDTSSAMKIGTDGVLLGAWALNGRQPRRIIDVGCGTGLVSIMLAQRFPQAEITAIEIDRMAADEARGNVSQSPWAERIEVVNCNFADYTPTGTVDSIVSNPPFFVEPLKSPLKQRAMARHQNELNPTSLIEWAAAILPDGGTLSLIAPAEQTDQLVYNAMVNHLDCARLTNVQPHADAVPIRALIELTKGLSKSYRTESLVIRSDDHRRYTEEYRSLTEAFYLDSTFD